MDFLVVQRSCTIQTQVFVVSLSFFTNHHQIKLLVLTFPKPVVWFSILQCAPTSIHQHRRKFYSNCLHRSGVASASAWIPLLYDTIIFGLTLYRTIPPIRRAEASYIIKRLLEDGILYYRCSLHSVHFKLDF